MTDQSDHLFREVDEDLQRDRWERLWRRHGRLAVAAAVAVVLLAAAWVGWSDYRLGQQEALSARFSAAMDLAGGQDPATAADAFAQLADGAPGGYAALARLRQAALLAESGDAAAAAAVYEGVAADDGSPRALRDAAAVLYGYHGIGVVGADLIRERIGGLAGAGSAWRHSAREILALLDVDAGDVAAARERFEELAADETAPRELRDRASEMTAALEAS